MQQALNIARGHLYPHLERIEKSTIAICFLGTPHHGSDLASFGAILTDVINIIKPANRNIVKVLKGDSEMLAEVQDRFFNMLEIRKKEKADIQIVCFYEMIMVYTRMIVPSTSAIIRPYPNYGIRANHMVRESS